MSSKDFISAAEIYNFAKITIEGIYGKNKMWGALEERYGANSNAAVVIVSGNK